MKNSIYDINEQILRYYRNELSNGEEKILLSWINEREENKIYFREQLVIIETVLKNSISYDANKGLSEFLERTNKQTKLKRLKVSLSIAAVVLLILSSGATIYFIKSININKKKLYTSIAQSTQVILNDSSQVTLRHGSILKAPERFTKRQRIVEFKGQAYFNITPDKKRAFKIIIDRIMVEVLGTSFEIKTDSISENVEIRIEKGTIKVSNRGTQQEFILQKGEQIIINQHTDYYERTELKGNNYLAWKTKKLNYQGAKMEKVAIDLMELYNKRIIFSDSTLKDCEVTFSINSQSLGEVLLMLEKLLTVEAFELDSTVVLAGAGCENN